MNINEEQNPAKLKMTFNRETTLFGMQYCLQLHFYLLRKEWIVNKRRAGHRA